MSIATIITQLLAALSLRETSAPQILDWKVTATRKRTGRSQCHSEYDDPERSITNLVGRHLIRPFRFIGTHPIIQLLAFYVAYFYGVLYIMVFIFPLLWTPKYHQSIGNSSLNYISTGIGHVAGSQSKFDTNL